MSSRNNSVKDVHNQSVILQDYNCYIFILWGVDLSLLTWDLIQEFDDFRLGFLESQKTWDSTWTLMPMTRLCSNFNTLTCRYLIIKLCLVMDGHTTFEEHLD